MGKRTTVKKPVKKSKTSKFEIRVPVGTEKVTLTKSVIRSLLQGFCNLRISDYQVSEEEGSQKFEILFELTDIK